MRKKRNYLIVDGSKHSTSGRELLNRRRGPRGLLSCAPPAEMSVRAIEAGFKEFVARDDIAVILIAQNVANQIRHILVQHSKVRRSPIVNPHVVPCWHVLTRTSAPYTPLQPIPAVLEIPSKDCPYDPNQDSLLTRVKHIAGFN